jgi:predicted component of type VI protein secretion system
VNVSLLMVQKDGIAKDVPLRSLPVTIGRGEDCKLRIPLASVSRNHCELLIDDDELMVRDLKSSNGTFVNKDRVAKRELVPGDLLAVGPVVFVVRIDGHPKDVNPTDAFASGAVAVPGDGGVDAIAGVPTWSGQQGGAAAGAAKPKAPAPAPAAGKPGKNDELAQIDSLLDDLGESDFDIDLDDKPKKK